MPIDTHDPTAALSQLSTELADTIKGFELLAERGAPELRDLSRELHEMHEAHAAEILNAVEKMGGRPEDEGAMVAAVRRSVETADGWIDRPERKALRQVVEAERRLLGSYDEALDATRGHPDMAGLIRCQRAIIAARIEGLRGR